MNGESYVVYSRDCKVMSDGQVVRLGENDIVAAEVDVVESRNKFVKGFFTTNTFLNMVVLAGAGTSVSCGGCVRGTLWKNCAEQIKRVGVSFKGKYEKMKYESFKKDSDIEGFLSYAMQHAGLKGIKTQQNAIRMLKVAIRKECNLTLKGETHMDFLRKLTARKSSLPRPEVFTTNYDTLFEQAAHKAGIVLIDGFSFGCPRKFFGRSYNFDIVDREKSRVRGEENYIPNVVRLFKLHGSVDWVRNGDDVMQREVGNGEEPMMIYPSTNKYAESYNQPYFEMMARFQASLRKKDCLLIVCGYGFGDQHINSVILEALNQNPSFTLFILDYGIKDGATMRIDIETVRKNLESNDLQGNVIIVQGTFDDLVMAMPLIKAYAVDESHETYVCPEGWHVD